MSGISVDIIVLILRGIPECMLAVLSLHIFTKTKIDLKKYFFICFVYILSTYLIRLLPIALGVNTVLALFVMIITFQFVYNGQLSQVIGVIAAATGTLLLVAISEVLNMFLLIGIYDFKTAQELFNSSNGLVKSISTMPSSVFFSILLYISYRVIKIYEKRKGLDGESSKKVSK